MTMYNKVRSNINNEWSKKQSRGELCEPEVICHRLFVKI